MGSIRRKLGGGDRRRFKKSGGREVAEGAEDATGQRRGGRRQVVGTGIVEGTEEVGSKGAGEVEATVECVRYATEKRCVVWECVIV